MTKLLLSSGADIKNSPELLNMAVEKHEMEIVEALLQLYADVNACDKYGRTPLHSAAIRNQKEVAGLLISYKADINALDKSGKTPIFYAIENANLKITKLLLSSGADIKNSPELLNLAVEKREMKIVKALLQHDADVNACDKYGRTALHIASQKVYTEAVATLLRYGAFKYLTPLDCAMMFINKYPSNKTTAEVLHIYIMRTVNLYVKNSTRLKIERCKFRRMMDDCKVEIEIMKCEKINNANVSFYDILAKGINSTAMYLRNEDVLLALKSGDYKRKFPLYAGMIELNFNKGLKRKELLEQVNKVSHFLFNNFLELPQDCTEKIFSYLNDKDLRILIEACKAI